MYITSINIIGFNIKQSELIEVREKTDVPFHNQSQVQLR